MLTPSSIMAGTIVGEAGRGGKGTRGGGGGGGGGGGCNHGVTAGTERGEEGGRRSGQGQRGGRSIRLYVAGTQAAPDGGLLDRVRDLIDRFASVERSAMDFLHARGKDVRHGGFEFYSLDFLWEDEPYLYALEFTRTG